MLTYEGTWTSSGGEVMDSKGGRRDKLITGDPTLNDMLFSSEIRFDSDRDFEFGDAGLVWRASNLSTGTDSMYGYYAGIRPGTQTLKLGRMEDDYTVPVWSRSHSNSFQRCGPSGRQHRGCDCPRCARNREHRAEALPLGAGTSPHVVPTGLQVEVPAGFVAVEKGEQRRTATSTNRQDPWCKKRSSGSFFSSGKRSG